MERAPKGRKRQFSKHRSVVGNVRVRAADTMPDGSIRQKVGSVLEMKVRGDGVEHRVNLLKREHVGSGRMIATLLMTRCGSSELKSRCKQLLWHFGPDWCQRATFVGCRFTVADVLVPRDRGQCPLFEAVNHSANVYPDGSPRDPSGLISWVVNVPSVDQMLSPDWLTWVQPDVLIPDHSSGERAHNYAYRGPAY